jgi:hypothetical protein
MFLITLIVIGAQDQRKTYSCTDCHAIWQARYAKTGKNGNNMPLGKQSSLSRAHWKGAAYFREEFSKGFKVHTCFINLSATYALPAVLVVNDLNFFSLFCE